MTKLNKVLITSPPDREAVVAEIYFDAAQFAELRMEDRALACEIYPAPDRGAWNISLQDLEQALTIAKAKLAQT